MPCDPNSTSINVPTSPGIPISPFGSIPISPIQLPLPGGFALPNIESVLDLINNFSLVFPSSTFKPNLDDTTNTVLAALTSLLNQIAPFLSIYNFFQSAFNMILCLLEILCAFPNPFKMFRAMRRLFKRCLPDFLKIFPWLALLAMIISLLLLILALIEYIIATVENIIKDLLANLINLEEGLTLQNDDAVTATARKIAQLLCLIENLFSILIALGAIIAIIQALAGLTGRSACGGGGSPSAGDGDDCCSSDVCPTFISDNPNGITGISGELIYYHRINTDIQSMFHGLSPQQVSSFNLPAVRSESWQFINQQTNQPYPFIDIITPVNGGDIFFPEGVSFNKNTKPTKAPYTLDLTFNDYNPKVFVTSDSGKSRNFIIKNVIITQKPYVGVLDFDNELNVLLNRTGTFTLAGGLVYEIGSDLSQNPYNINGKQATIENFIHHDPTYGFLPNMDDGYLVGDVNFTLNINHETLINYGLITLGCHPDIAQERFIANTRVESTGFDAIAVRLPSVGANGILPDAIGTQKCTAASIEKLRKSVSPENVAIFQAEISACLDQFKSETLASYCNILKAGVSIYESTISTNVDVEFITRTIKASVQLLDPNGTIISFNIPSSCASEIENLLRGEVSFGEISKFKYDGYSSFVADISTSNAGSGQLTVFYSGNTFKKILNSDNDSLQTAIKDNKIPYSFIGTNVLSKTSGAENANPIPRRDEVDVSGDK